MSRGRLIRGRLTRVLAVTACVALAGACDSSSSDSERSQSNPTATTTTVAPAVTPAATPVDGSLVTPDGRTRTYRLYVPASLPAGPAPLLIALHGGVGNGGQFENNSGFDGLAEANGFLVVYPDGIEIGGTGPLARGRVWNGGYCCGPAVTQNVDDVTYISMLIDTIAAEHDVDPDRVYAAGHSNGGIMAYRLACELSEKIVGVGLQAGSLGVEPCDPAEPVSLIHIHGTADQNHPIDGGVGPMGISGVDFHPAIDGVHTLVDAEGCKPEPATETSASDPNVTVQTWSGCDGRAEVEFVTVTGASHAYMGHPGTPITETLAGVPYPDLDASLTIWAFLATHPRAGAHARRLLTSSPAASWAA